MNSKMILKRKSEINDEYNKIENKKSIKAKALENEYNELTCREIINDYLYYGYGLKTFISCDYECAKNIKETRLKTLFKEQNEYLGSLY